MTNNFQYFGISLMDSGMDDADMIMFEILPGRNASGRVLDLFSPSGNAGRPPEDDIQSILPGTIVTKTG